MFRKSTVLARRIASAFLLILLCCASSTAEAIGLVTQYIIPSTGAIVPGVWNSNFDAALKYADARHVPMVVFFAGVSCGACEKLQLACISDEFTAWQAQKKLVMVFTTTGAARTFARPTDGSDDGLPHIAVYWNRDGNAPAKHSGDYLSFRGQASTMPATGDTLARAFINSIELVAGSYPYAGGNFLLPDGASTRLELEAGYPSGTTVVVPLSRTATPAYTNHLTCGDATVDVAWSVGEKEKLVSVAVPDGMAAGASIPLILTAANGSLYAGSEIAVVTKMDNSVRNPAWLGEDFSAGEWTMDIDAALSRVRAGEFRNVLLYFTGALWCPHCQGLEDGVLTRAAFKTWCVSNSIALVELDNPRRSDPSAPTNDYTITSASGAAPTLLRYAAGNNSYAGRQESGASYLTRKGIAVGAPTTVGTAEWVLQRNRRLGYAWGEGTYCAPGAGRTGYPTMILLKADGTVAGRFNNLEGDSYAHDTAENMARLDELLKLAGGAGEAANYPTTTARTLEVGGAAVAAELQVNDRVEYFKLTGVPTGRVVFTASGAPSDCPVALSVVRLAGGEVTTLASGVETVSCLFAGETDCLLKVESFAEARAYGRDSGFTATVASSLVLIPAEREAVFEPGERALSLTVERGVVYRLDGVAAPATAVLREDGVCELGGRLYTALSSCETALTASSDRILYQVWRPGVVAFDGTDLTAFTFQGTATVRATRTGGGSGSVSAKVKVVGGDAVNGERYVWNDATVFAWADGETGAKTATIQLLKPTTLRPNQTFSLGFAEWTGPSGVFSDAGLTVTLCDTDKPALPKTDYDVRMLATLDAESALAAQTVFNVAGDGKVTLKKVDGKLPTGVKLVYEDGQVKLTGASSKTGSFTYTFAVRQRQDGVFQTGPEVTLNFDVAAATDVAAGGNAFLGRALRGTLPLYAKEGGVDVLKGVLDFKTTTKNKITAKFSGLDKKKVTFKGLWQQPAEGTVTATLEAKNRTVSLSLDESGRVSGTYVNGGETLSTAGALRLCLPNEALAFAGYYTASIMDESSDDPMGHGYVTVKSVTASGKASWSGVLGNGQSMAGTAYVTFDGDGCAVVPVFVFKAKDWIAAPLRLRPNGSGLVFPRAVRNCPGTVARWAHSAAPASSHDCTVRGSWYNKRGALDECCYQQFAHVDLVLFAGGDGFTSGRYGAATAFPSNAVRVTASSLELEGRNKAVKLGFTKKTGIFKGTLKVAFGEKTVKATYKGVVLPGWHDCGCEAPDTTSGFGIDESQPFAVGGAWISDRVDGKSVKRGFPVFIGEAE